MRAFSKNTQNNNKPTTLVSQRKYAENTHFINLSKIQIVATTNFRSLIQCSASWHFCHQGWIQAGRCSALPAIPKPGCVFWPWPPGRDVGSAPKAGCRLQHFTVVQPPPAPTRPRAEGTQRRLPPFLSVEGKGGSRGILLWFLQYLWVHRIWPSSHYLFF